MANYRLITQKKHFNISTKKSYRTILYESQKIFITEPISIYQKISYLTQERGFVDQRFVHQQVPYFSFGIKSVSVENFFLSIFVYSHSIVEGGFDEIS